VKRNEQVGIITLGYVNSFFQFEKNICVTSVYNLYIRICSLDFLTKKLGNIENDMFLVLRRGLAKCARVFSTMSRVNDNGLQTQFLLLLGIGSERKAQKA
jgi:hypothetical protein